jgi:hypothetical protein
VRPGTTSGIYWQNLDNFRFIYIGLHNINANNDNNKSYNKYRDVTGALAHAVNVESNS